MKISRTLLAMVTVAVLMPGALFAQGFEIGIRYEVQKSILLNKSDKNAGASLDAENTMSYLNGGLAVGYNFNRMVGMEVDILQSRQGQSFTSTGIATATSVPDYRWPIAQQSAFNQENALDIRQAKAELNGIKIPILLKLSTDNRKTVSFRLLLGPQINIIYDAVYELNHEDIELTGTNITPKDAYKKATFDGVIAPGVNFNVSKHLVLNADLRMDYGFEDVENKSLTYKYLGSDFNYYGSGRAATHNFTIGLMVGASYRL